jgi:hypothetical protein
LVSPVPQKPTQTPNRAKSSFRDVCARPVSSEALDASTPSSSGAGDDASMRAVSDEFLSPQNLSGFMGIPSAN